jgi:hypothetical protein
MTLHGRYGRETENWGGPVPIRMVGEQHFLPLMSVERFAETLRHPFLSYNYSSIPNFRSRKEVFHPVRERVYRELENFGGLTARPWPSNIEHLVRPDASRHKFEDVAKAFDGHKGLLDLDDAARADIAATTAFFKGGFDGYSVINGAVHRPIPEPCYIVDANTGLISSVVPYDLAPSPYIPSDVFPFTSAHHFFAADRLDEAKAFSASLGRDRFALEMLEAKGAFIELHGDHLLLGHDYAAAGLHRTAREMLGWLGAPNYPNTKIELALEDLGREVECCGPYDPSQGLEEAVRAAVALEEVAPTWYNPRIAPVIGRQIELQLERQDMRPIGVALKGPGL